MTNRKIAIIGFGAAGLAFLIHFLNGYKGGRNLVKLTIYEKDANFSKGYVYQDDKDHIKLNRHYTNMTLYQRGDASFQVWAEYHYAEEVKKYNGYLPRRIFGEYMQYEYERLKLRFSSIIHEKKLLASQVIFGENKKYFVLDENQESEEFDDVILAMGHLEPKNLFNLTGNYINNPYPSTVLDKIPKNKKIGIIGTGLTAIDVALSLVKLGHTGEIFLSSRNGYVHDVKEDFEEMNLEFFNADFLNSVSSKNNKIREALKVFILELKKIGKLRLKEIYKNNVPASMSAKDLQNFLFSINLNVEKLWTLLNDQEKQDFFCKYFHFWVRKKASVSPENYKELHDILAQGRVSISSGLSKVEQKNEQYYMHTDKQIMVDYIINATGSPRHLHDIDNKLIQGLIRKKMAVYNRYGGISVNKDTNTVEYANGKTSDSLFAIGHMTCGTFLFSSYINHVVDRAKIVAEHMNNKLLNQE